MIPKIINYCWFGKNPKDKLAKKCIKSWKKRCGKKWQIIEWNEDNVDISLLPKFVRQAYENKQWAFVSDYVRLKVVYENGGFYFDTDVKLLKNPTFLTENSAFFGIQCDNIIATGLGFGAEKNSKIVKDLMDVYNDLEFSVDNKANLTCPDINLKVFEAYGFRSIDENQILLDGTKVFSSEYFCPMNFNFICDITKNSVSVHLFNASWTGHSKENEKKRKAIQRNNLKHKLSPKTILFKILGEKKYNKLKNIFKKNK